jgi:23S rRNA (guanosine2251-2'-O)-methyltransferase
MSRKLNNEELNRLSNEAYAVAGKNSIILILDNIRSLHNVGSAFRTADAFRIEKIFLCGVTGTPPNREIEKTALGATETVNWVRFSSTSEAVARARQEGYKILAVEQAENSVMLDEVGPLGKEKMAFVFGNEVYGVEQEIVSGADAVVEIPQLGTKHSLNVSVSVGIVLWEILRGSPHRKIGR